MNRKDKNSTTNKYYYFMVIFISIYLGILSCIFPKEKTGMYILIIMMMIFIVLFLAKVSRFTFEESMIILFFLFLPFMTELNLYVRDDYHIVAKEYYRFNYLHLFTIYFFIKIIINIKRVKKGIDIYLLLLFNLICIFSIFRARNIIAGFQDYFRYLNITIVYIYFSRVCDLKKYKNYVMNSLFIGLCIQLILGLLQKVKGGRLGLTIIGEGNEVFRLGVDGYEKGMSGTFGHPGPMGLYCDFILIIFLFNRTMNKKIRAIGIAISSSIIILTAGRTSILIMVGIFSIYLFSNCIKFNIKNIMTAVGVSLILIFGVITFNEELKPIISRFVSSDMEFQYSNRLSHVEVGMEYVKKSPIIGLGLNNYLDNTYNDYPLSFYNNFLLWNPIHNMYIQYTVEVGIVGISVLMLYLITFFIMYFKLRSKVNYEERTVYKGSLLILIVWLIYGLQGWGGIQTRSLLVILISCSLISNTYYNRGKQVEN